MYQEGVLSEACDLTQKLPIVEQGFAEKGSGHANPVHKPQKGQPLYSFLGSLVWFEQVRISAKGLK